MTWFRRSVKSEAGRAGAFLAAVLFVLSGMLGLACPATATSGDTIVICTAEGYKTVRLDTGAPVDEAPNERSAHDSACAHACAAGHRPDAVLHSQPVLLPPLEVVQVDGPGAERVLPAINERRSPAIRAPPHLS